MPELPEVEHASRLARRAAAGQVIARVEVRHAAQRRGLPLRTARSLAGDKVLRVTRRAKYQAFHLASGRTLVVHFRMTGDWEVVDAGEPLPPHARVELHFVGGRALVLTDPRALSTVHVVAEGESPLPVLGPEATDRGFSAAYLRGVLARRTARSRPPSSTSASWPGSGTSTRAKRSGPRASARCDGPGRSPPTRHGASWRGCAA